ncbi:MAG: Outer membrane efflux protein, partial [Berkelbacteria bacterium GW2011_GWA2_46_7]
LPKLVAAAGYHDRSNDLTTRSKDSVTGAPSLANPFISSSRASRPLKRTSAIPSRQSAKASLIMSVFTLSGAGANGRWEQDGYRPYLKDDTTYGSTFGKLGTDFASDKTGALVAYSPINNATDKGGAILATSVGVGTAIASSRGGVTGTPLGWHSYCAKSDTTVDGNGVYTCNSNASRYLPTLPDAEDLLFMLNAAQALGATDTYKVVGYYGGVKRGYLVTSVSGTLPKVYEIVP